jgi:CO/xanthine dehydrogenase FAD-binding subunit
MAEHPEVLFPSSLTELFSLWKRFPCAVPFAGGTWILRAQGSHLPDEILSLDAIEEIKRITRTEQYLEIGSMVKLSQIKRLGKMVPDVLINCLDNIAGPQICNTATIGGNVCSAGHDLSLPLAALDAQYELRNSQTFRWIMASRFSSQPDLTLEKQELLTRIRIPFEEWDYSVYRKFPGQSGNNAVVFMLKNQKAILTDVRLFLKTDSIFRDKNSEDLLAGKKLPLNRKVADDFTKSWVEFLSGIQELSPIPRKELINCIAFNVYNLCE